MDLHLDIDPDQPLAAQLYRQLRDAILGGRLAGGARLPPTRYLAQRLQVSRKTVSEAYEQLLAEGFTTTRVGSGTFVSAAAQAPVPPRLDAGLLQPARRWHELAVDPLDRPPRGWRYDFAGGTVSMRRFPLDAWRTSLHHALRQLAQGSGFYAGVEGQPALRQAIARYLAASRAVRCDWHDLLVTQGAQQGLSLLAQVMLEPGARVAMEEPGYTPARSCFLAAGAEVIGVPVDGEGLRVDLLPTGVRLVYVTPSHQFPLGMPMSLGRRLALLEWARRQRALIIEDDYDGEFRFQGRPLEALQSLDRHGLVAYLGTFSKTLYPQLRVGYLAMPPGLRESLVRAKLLGDRHGDSLQQLALAHFMERGEFARHTRRMQRLYAERRERLLQRLHGDLAPWLQPVVPMAGIHLAALLRAGVDAERLAGEMAERGIGLDSLASFYQGTAQAGLLFGFGCIELDELEAGLDELRLALQAACQ
ncbi:MocR-like pyridoxine biosynthesis transcription factor PdxR [Pseudomonas sp. SP16.1]|uniref:MocR-like pyridoxine biosynthesis transcription factor PdxR n=1 Tax=Pseudomonas sp. SP16.1 TaxID=3458854 RepID=UPI004045F46C